MSSSERLGGTEWFDPSRRTFWLLLLAFCWILLGLIVRHLPELAGPAVGAGVGATISVAVLLANRDQSRRQTTLDLLTEYYTPEFALNRRAAERFMATHSAADWSQDDPYILGDGDPDLAGYGAVVRYWQRVAILDLEGELRSRLAYRLLAREVGYWNAILFDPMAVRPNMYVRGLLNELVERFSKGQADSFEFGQTAGRVQVAKAEARKSSTT
ncbi:hypothetical protein [Aureimonas sp. AU22]|uniref:hypothetical protein n=1 Tax=Aureimonas sp. AU22 TaxID=1638162 RepID=UPI0007803BD5|nr:hypothetical protein [Aureimonas sp. AU22]